MAEIVYSGGWVGLMIAFLAILFYRSRELREDSGFILHGVFVTISGLGLWIMQGNNLITGTLTETGEHIRMLIFPWLIFSTISVGMLLWRERGRLSKGVRRFSIVTLIIVSVTNLYYTHYYFSPFFKIEGNREAWQAQQLYAKPLSWLDEQEENPVVVWSEPHDPLSAVLPIYSKHFVLNTYWGMLELVPEGEIRERYLVSQYFNNPTRTDLQSESEMGLYLGRGDMFHKPATLNRKVKICQILFFWDQSKNCGVLTTPQELLGEAFFSGLADKFQSDIRPNIKAYLKKYHVSYIIKDKILNPTYRPEVLGAQKVYTDERYEIYRLP
jgi:hypothetical protein